MTGLKPRQQVPGVQLIKIPGNKDFPARLGGDFNLEEIAGNVFQPDKSLIKSQTDIFMRYYQIITNPELKELMETIEQLRSELSHNGSERESEK